MVPASISRTLTLTPTMIRINNLRFKIKFKKLKKEHHRLGATLFKTACPTHKDTGSTLLLSIAEEYFYLEKGFACLSALFSFETVKPSVVSRFQQSSCLSHQSTTITSTKFSAYNFFYLYYIYLMCVGGVCARQGQKKTYRSCFSPSPMSAL